MQGPLSSTDQGRLACVRQRPAHVRDGVRVYAVGDVHGRADLLKQLFSGIDADLAAHPILRVIHVFLGDYIDRGPASREVLDLLIERGRQYRSSVYLKGNHEAFLEMFLRRPEILSDWRQVGGIETLLSYGLRPNFNSDTSEQKALAKALAKALPQAHRNFLRRLRLSFSCGDFFFAHAGVRPGIPLVEQKEQDLLWIRDDFLRCGDDFGKIVVHGHSPVREVEFHSNRINIDTGAFATGNLTCLRIERDCVIFFAGTHVGAQRIYISDSSPRRGAGNTTQKRRG